MLYIDSVNNHCLTLRTNLYREAEGSKWTCLNLTRAERLIAVLDGYEDEVEQPDFKLYRCTPDSGSDYMYRYVLDDEHGGLTIPEANVLKHALHYVCHLLVAVN